MKDFILRFAIILQFLSLSEAFFGHSLKLPIRNGNLLERKIDDVDLLIFDEDEFEELTGNSQSGKAENSHHRSPEPSLDSAETVDKFRFVIDSSSVKRTIARQTPQRLLNFANGYHPQQVFDVDWYDEPKILNRHSAPQPKEMPLENLLNYTLQPAKESLFDQSFPSASQNQATRNPGNLRKQFLWKSDIDLLVRNYLLFLAYFTSASLAASALYYSSFKLWRKFVTPCLQKLRILVSTGLILFVQTCVKMLISFRRNIQVVKAA